MDDTSHSPRRTTTAESIASVLLAVALGVIFAAALIHWVDLEGITSSAAVLALPGGNLWRRLCLSWRRAYTHGQLRAVEDELAWMADEVQMLPERQRIYREHAQALRVSLATMERDSAAGQP